MVERRISSSRRKVYKSFQLNVMPRRRLQHINSLAFNVSAIQSPVLSRRMLSSH
ncbi:unnamed protein product [Fusarium graminearum]|nr:unnamed protein product [Fusarium graminearum]